MFNMRKLTATTTKTKKASMNCDDSESECNGSRERAMNNLPQQEMNAFGAATGLNLLFNFHKAQRKASRCSGNFRRVLQCFVNET